jgi:hypothetical protein
MLKNTLILIVLATSQLFFSQTKVTICWDASQSMIDRDIKKEFDFLNNYFKFVSDAEVTLITFSNDISGVKSFSIEKGQWNDLKEAIEDIPLDGATSYKELVYKIDGGDILIFTDGNQNYNNSSIKLNGDLFVINTSKNGNMEELKFLTNLNNGRLIDLTSISVNNELRSYKGKVFREIESDDVMTISIKDTDRSTQPESDGSYFIEAVPGDVIVITQDGKHIMEKVLDENQYNNIWIDAQGIRLEEVVVIGNIEIADDNEENKVNTGYGEKNKDGLGYGIQSIKDEDVSEINSTVSDAINGKFSGLNKGINDDISQSVIRGYSSILLNNYPLVVLDGVPLPRSNSAKNAGVPVQITDFIDPNNIADITVLKGLAATNRFGSEGSGGVILITSKSTADLNEGGKKKHNSALIKNNVYVGNTVKTKDVLITPYINELRNAGDAQMAYKTYLIQKKKYVNEPFYFTDTFDFFLEKDPKIAYRILSNIIEDNDSSIESLRGMMFKAINNNQRDLTLKVADIILERFPGLTQSYFDIALAHKNKGNYQIALNMFMGIDDGSINPELDFSGLQKCAKNEIRNLITRFRGQLKTSNIPVKYNTKASLDARLVFDWNNPDAEFEIQFVNPSKRFFKWLHTSDNLNEIKDELKNGYSQEEFEIIGGEKGIWIINVKYLGNRTKGNTMPTYLKCTVQYNFGRPNQKNEEHLIRLSRINQEQLFAKIITR